MMGSPKTLDNEFLKKVTEITETNLINQHFGVSALARELGMSRSNLHRKVIINAKITISQFICHVRLKKALDILRHTTFTVSEVAYKVGFGSVSYFIKCFHEYYGYTPGEVGNREEDESNSLLLQTNNKRLKAILISVVSIVVLIIVMLVVFKPFTRLEKSISLLPPSFASQDSSSLIEINGIIQNAINYLSLIEEIKTIPWLSVVQYTNSAKSAPEISSELKANYLIKPTVSSLDSNIQLKLNLIEGKKNKQFATLSYDIDLTDLTTIAQKITKDIAKQFNIQVTLAEQNKINKRITDNNEALKLYNEGVELLYRGTKKQWEQAITCFEKALELDDKCAAAYAQLARTYYWLDWHWRDQHNPAHEIKFGKEINKYADKALKYDSQLDLSLLAKALFYQNEKEYEMAIDYLESALEYNSNSFLVIRHLCRLYAITNNNEKFIEYARKAINLNLVVSDSTSDLGKEYIYSLLGRQYRVMGFFIESLEYLDKALEINPNNVGVINEKSQVILDLGEEDNYQESRDLLLNFVLRDYSNSTTFAFLGLACYVMRDYPSAKIYYEKMLELIESNSEVYMGNLSGRLAIVYSETGEPEKAQKQINNYYEHANSHTSKFNCLHLNRYYSYMNETEKAIEQMRILSEYRINYFEIRLFKDAPIYDNIRDHPQFQKLLFEMETKWHAKHDSIKVVFEKKGFL